METFKHSFFNYKIQVYFGNERAPINTQEKVSDLIQDPNSQSDYTSIIFLKHSCSYTEINFNGGLFPTTLLSEAEN